MADNVIPLGQGSETDRHVGFQQADETPALTKLGCSKAAATSVAAIMTENPAGNIRESDAGDVHLQALFR